jgi:predicted nucleic-acid-binding Zn-ribbon protein
MKSSKRCPKCEHTEILFFPQIADRDDRDNVRPLAVHVTHYDWKDDDEIGKIQAYVCRACGYTELYTKEPGAIPVTTVPGVELHQAPGASKKTDP